MDSIAAGLSFKGNRNHVAMVPKVRQSERSLAICSALRGSLERVTLAYETETLELVSCSFQLRITCVMIHV